MYLNLHLYPFLFIVMKFTVTVSLPNRFASMQKHVKLVLENNYICNHFYRLMTFSVFYVHHSFYLCEKYMMFVGSCKYYR